jgi:hypothetical protein
MGDAASKGQTLDAQKRSGILIFGRARHPTKLIEQSSPAVTAPSKSQRDLHPLGQFPNAFDVLALSQLGRGAADRLAWAEADFRHAIAVDL